MSELGDRTLWFCFGNNSFNSGKTKKGTRHLYWIFTGPSFAVQLLVRLHCTENWIYIFSEKELRSLIPDSYIHVSVSDLYIPGSVHIFSWSRIGRPIVGIYKSLTDTWTWKLGLRPRNSFSGIICFEFAVFAVHSEVRTNHGQWYHSLDDLIWLVCPFNFILIVKTSGTVWRAVRARYC